MRDRNTIRYDDETWRISFRHPAGWRVVEQEEQHARMLSLRLDGAEGDALPRVTLRSVNVRSSEMNGWLERRAAELGRVHPRFKAIVRDVRTLGDSSRRAVLLFEHAHAGQELMTQEVAFPLPSGELLVFSATALRSTWAEHRAQFSSMVSSLAALEVDSAADLEIVFTGPASGSDNAASKPVRDPARSKRRTFEEFASAFDGDWRACARQEELVELCCDEHIAKVLWCALRGGALEWLTRPAPALGGKTPRHLVRTEAGREAVRQLLSKLDCDARDLAALTAAEAPLLLDGEEGIESLRQLLSMPDAEKDAAWIAQVAELLPQVHFYVGESPAMIGPDNLPYYVVFTGARRAGGGSRRASLPEVLEHVTESGMGVAVDPTAESQFVLPYGALWALRSFGRIPVPGESNPYAEPPPGAARDAVWAGRPNERLLPPFARQVLRELFLEAGQRRPAVYLEANPMRDPPNALIFDLGETPGREEERAALAALVSWYVPSGLAFAFVESTPERKRLFVEL